MTLFLLVLAILVIIYLLRTRGKQQTPHAFPSNDPLAEAKRHDGLPGITVERRPVPSVAIDLRNHAERPFRVVATNHWVDPDTMERYPADYFFLHREPENEYDGNAVAVYGGDRKFGYLEAAAAAEYAPLLDQIGTDFIVARDQIYFGGDQFRLPHVPILRKLIEDEDLSHWHPRT